jgi:SNF2 family DNA or RNA helicase
MNPEGIFRGKDGRFWILRKDGGALYRGRDQKISRLLEQEREEKHLILPEESPIFFHEIFPSINRNYPVSIDESISIPIISELADELKIQVHWDPKKTVLSVFSTLPPAAEDLIKEEAGVSSRRFHYYRDAEKNYLALSKDIFNRIRRIMRAYAEDESEEGLPRFVLGDFNRVVDFVFEGLPALEEEFDVSCNEEFRELQLVRLKDVSLDMNGEGTEQKIDFFEICFDIDGIRVSFQDMKKILRSPDKYHRLADGKIISTEDFGKGLSPVLDDLNTKNKIPLNQYYFLYRQMERQGLKIRQDEKLEGILNRLSGKETVEDLELSREINRLLRPYQREGINWMNFLAQTGFGGILADDMGLGKTLQALSLIAHTLKEYPSMVVCPTSLIYNWKEEVEKFYPHLKAMPVYGTKEERRETIENWKDADILITSYAVLQRDIELYEDKVFDYVILDEAQNIKNAETRNAMSVKKLQSRFRFVLTGTPIENSLSELWSIFDFIMPGYLPNRSRFKKGYEKPIESGNTFALEKLKNRVRPFILRRLKKDVLKELPEKMEEQLSCELNENQKKLYLSILGAMQEKLRNTVREKGFENSKIEILSALTKLRQVCCHPALIGEEKGNLQSAKMELLLELLEEAMGSGRKVLLFSQFVSMLQIIEKELIRRRIGYEFLHGGSRNRMDIVKRFNENPDTAVFLLSLKAGGTGLNLTSADIVIHYDPWWNPAAEEQAADRCYRMGQENKVNVYRLITRGTIEEKIMKLQERKKDLVEKVIHTGESPLGKLSWEDYRELLEIKE